MENKIDHGLTLMKHGYFLDVEICRNTKIIIGEAFEV